MGKKNWGKKIFGSKNFWVEKFLGHKNFWDKKMLDPKFFSFEKKTGRVNPRGRIYAPPPPKIVGLKLCWIVVSFAW